MTDPRADRDLLAEVRALHAEITALRKLQPVAWSAIQAMRDIERHIGREQFAAAANVIKAYLGSVPMNDEPSTVTTTWPMSATTERLQAEMDVVMREALAGRIPATRLRLAEAVVEAAREWCGGEQKLLPRRVARALAAYDQAVRP